MKHFEILNICKMDFLLKKTHTRDVIWENRFWKVFFVFIFLISNIFLVWSWWYIILNIKRNIFLGFGLLGLPVLHFFDFENLHFSEIFMWYHRLLHVFEGCGDSGAIKKKIWGSVTFCYRKFLVFPSFWMLKECPASSELVTYEENWNLSSKKQIGSLNFNISKQIKTKKSSQNTSQNCIAPIHNDLSSNWIKTVPELSIKSTLIYCQLILKLLCAHKKNYFPLIFFCWHDNYEICISFYVWSD